MAFEQKGDMDICRNLLTRSLSTRNTVIATSATTLTYNSFSTTQQIFTGTTAGQIVNLGDAQGYLDPGLVYHVVNASTEDIVIEDFGNNELETLPSCYCAIITLRDQATQDGIWDICVIVPPKVLANSASPGYAYGREGAISNNTWLICVETASNKRGLPFGLINGSIEKLTVSTENTPAAFTVAVYYHDGNLSGLTLVGSVTTTATASTEDFIVNWAVPKDHQLAVKISSVGTPKPKNPGVFLVVKGEIA